MACYVHIKTGRKPRSRVIYAAATVFAVCTAGWSISPSTAAADPLRPQATVSLTFDEPSGDALDTSVAGMQKNKGQLVNAPVRVPSPFWGQKGKQALLLDAASRQFVQLADNADTDRPDAATIAFFFLNLHAENDGAAHGIFAKRAPDPAKSTTNYGINFVPASNLFQVYVNDGRGFRHPTFAFNDVLGTGRRTFLTATFELGDAPAPDDDADKDDLLVRLFVNGVQLKPSQAAGVTLADNDAWVTDVDAKGLLNDVPLVLGASTPENEHTSGVIDEFCLFPRALSAAEVAQLFTEIAGPDAPQLAQAETTEPANPPPPAITELSHFGLRPGYSTRLTVTGSGLAARPRLVLPAANVTAAVLPGATDQRVVFDVLVPRDTPSGYYPLRIATDRGASNALGIAIDRLAEMSAASSSATNPAALPSAFNGTVSGSESPRVYFVGRKRQRIVADVDARRIGSPLNAVVEVKTSRGLPIGIEWGHAALRGDARAEVVLPEDGLYWVEIHDLEYKAPARSPFRLKLGDIAAVDGFFPPAATAGAPVNVLPMGTGIPADLRISAAVRGPLPGTRELIGVPPALPGPAPALVVSDGVEVVEDEQRPADQPQTVDCRFPENRHVPIFLNGRIVNPGHVDRYLLSVKPGDTLSLAIRTRGIDSPMTGRLVVLKPGEVTQLARSDEGSSSPDTSFDFAVPAGIENVELAVSDMFNRGGSNFAYRVRIVPAGQPDFSLATTNSLVSIPENGTAPLRLDINRTNYGGPIRLSVAGDPAFSVVPDRIPEGGNQTTFLTLKRRGDIGTSDIRQLTIVGESEGLTPPIRRAVSVSGGSDRPNLPGFNHDLTVAIRAPVSLAISLPSPPAVLFKGIDVDVPVSVARSGRALEQDVVLTLESTEMPRRADPQNAGKGNKPLVRSSFGVVGRGEARTHAFSRYVHAAAYSDPFRAAIREACTVDLDANSFNLTGGAENKLRGTVKRAVGFSGDVVIAVAGLPEGYTAAAATVPNGQEAFELSITAGNEEKPRDVNNVVVSIRTSGGAGLLPDRTIALKVAAGKKP